MNVSLAKRIVQLMEYCMEAEKLCFFQGKSHVIWPNEPKLSVSRAVFDSLVGQKRRQIISKQNK
jgi:hypothetical protein